jgi:hypothetical protein
MAVKRTPIRFDTDLADWITKSRTRAIKLIRRDVVALRRFKNLMKKNAGKLEFAGSDERRGSEVRFGRW